MFRGLRYRRELHGVLKFCRHSTLTLGAGPLRMKLLRVIMESGSGLFYDSNIHLPNLDKSNSIRKDNSRLLNPLLKPIPIGPKPLHPKQKPTSPKPLKTRAIKPQPEML